VRQVRQVRLGARHVAIMRLLLQQLRSPSKRDRWWLTTAIAFDVVISVYVVALLISWTFGGISLGWLSITQSAKPFLLLWILVPTRLALPVPADRTTPLGSLCNRLAFIRPLANRIPAAVVDAGFAFVATRLAAVAVGFFANLLFETQRVRPFALPFRQSRLAETFAAWDAGWYFDIAARGYYYTADGQSSIAFFPLYPLTMRMLAAPFGGSEAAIWLAGIAVSNLAFFCGLVALHRLSERIFADRDAARRTVLYVAAFPFSFFMTSVYPSALFFLLVVLAVSAACQSRWLLAGVMGGLAAVTRPHGILVAIPLGLMALQAGNARQKLARLAQLAPVPLALCGYSLYVYSLSGDPLAWLSSQQQWGFSLWHPPWRQVLNVIIGLERQGPYDFFVTSEDAAYRFFHAAAALFLVAMTPSVFRRLGTPLGLWVLVSLLIPLSGNSLEGIGRYGAALFPIFMVLGEVRSRRLHEALLIVWSLFLALFLGLFVTWQPIF
jgi:hypothetical protein